MMGMLYGFGASVVIVGALFKIQHWPGAGPMLIIGLSTEAVIFAFSAFQPPHAEYDWSLVYPELAGMEEDEEKRVDSGKGVTEQLDDMLEDAKIEPELLESLGNGLRSLSENANKLSSMSDATVATDEYVESLRGASTKVSELSENYVKASESLSGLLESREAGASAGEHLQAMSQNLAELNNVYELQLKGTKEHLETANQMYEGIGDLMTNLNSSVEDTKKYKENISELSQNLGALNTVYGNMLTAMNINSPQPQAPSAE